MRSLILFAIISLSASLLAQPSGGPYGPIDQRYDVPKAAHVYYVAPDGKADASGASVDQPTTLESAIEHVVTGDAIILRGGVYRTGGLVLNQGVTIQPYLDERPILKGTDLATKWESLRNNVWRTKWDHLFPAAPLSWWQRSREGIRTPLYKFNNDMVFVDGEMLKPVGWEGELDPHSFVVDYKEGYIYIGVDPTSKQVEITAHDSALVRTSADVHGKTNDHKGPVIRGITFTQYAYRALEVEGKKHFTVNDEPTDEPVGLSDPSTFGKEVTGTVLENVTITYCTRVAGYFRGDGLIIRNSLVSNTGTEGIYVIGSSDVLLEHNIIRHNNMRQLTGYYASAVKIFNQTRRVVFRDNLILDQPDSNGVWYDVGNRDGVIVDNYVEGALVGIMVEISRGSTIAGNVVVRCGRGVWALNSADVHVYNNTFYDTQASFERNQRSKTADHFGWHPSTGPDVNEREGHIFVNNLLVASDSYTNPLLRFEQPKAVCGQLTKPMATEINGNVYVRATSTGGSAASPLVQWSPASTDDCLSKFNSLDDFRKQVSGFESAGRQLNLTPRSVFKSVDIDRYELQHPLPPSEGSATPAEVLKLLGWTADQAHTAGAYPAMVGMPGN